MKNICDLYNKIYLNKKNIIIISISIIFVVVISLLNIEYNVPYGMFILYKEMYINNYIEEVFNIVMILNSVIIPILVIGQMQSEQICLSDILGVRVGFERLKLLKIYVLSKIIIYISLLEFIIIALTPIFIYPINCFSVEIYNTIIYMVLYNIFIMLITFLLSFIIKTLMISVFPVIFYFLSLITIDSLNMVTILPNFECFMMKNYLPIYNLVMLNILLIFIIILIKKNKKMC